ncbi:hypothetical protein C8R46DRAFT_1037613 [Mycena filopes]|nr:hypothetical protein C8R46DRAFT_1037613 [Mycena filopes]
MKFFEGVDSVYSVVHGIRMGRKTDKVEGVSRGLLEAWIGQEEDYLRHASSTPLNQTICESRVSGHQKHPPGLLVLSCPPAVEPAQRKGSCRVVSVGSFHQARVSTAFLRKFVVSKLKKVFFLRWVFLLPPKLDQTLTAQPNSVHSPQKLFNLIIFYEKTIFMKSYGQHFCFGRVDQPGQRKLTLERGRRARTEAAVLGKRLEGDWESANLRSKMITEGRNGAGRRGRCIPEAVATPGFVGEER